MYTPTFLTAQENTAVTVSSPSIDSDSPSPPVLDENEQLILDGLLIHLEQQADDATTLKRLDGFLTELLIRANEAIDLGQKRPAQDLLFEIKKANPEQAGLEETQSRLDKLDELEALLTRAEQAIQEDRIAYPEEDNAWLYFQQAADLDSRNQQAQLGFLEVQQLLIDQAMEKALAGDFDAAEMILYDASLVRSDPVLVDQAKSEVNEIKVNRALELESSAISAMKGGDFKSAELILIDLVALGGQEDRLRALRQKMKEAQSYGGFSPGQLIQDKFLTAEIWTPSTVVIPIGSFIMGSPPKEDGRVENEGPQHRVTFHRGFAMGQHEVTVEEFGLFVEDSGYQTDASRHGQSTVYNENSGRLARKDDVDWRHNYEGKAAKPSEPVIHVSWNDAAAYVDWLSTNTGVAYRLPSETEFEYVLRGGSNSRYWWGEASPDSVIENLTGDGDVSYADRRWSVAFKNYSDGAWGPAAVASYETNPFYVYDMGGNVGEWVQDCWHDTYVRAPFDGSAWVNPGCKKRVIRGGFWASSPNQTRSAYRRFVEPAYHDARIGFRIARDL